MSDVHATRIATADGQAVTVTSHTRSITDWADRYFGAWWTATPATVPATGPSVTGEVDRAATEELSAYIARHTPQTCEYAGTPMLYTSDSDGTVTAAQPGEQLAYRWEPGLRRMLIVGADETAVATAVSRLAREVVRGQLLAVGWEIMHASAVTNQNGATLLTFGGKGAGKTSSAFLLARAGWHLLANDRIFVRADPETGIIRILPWPSAAAAGFGLLSALGLFEPVRQRLLAGERMHPTQKQAVTDALVNGDTTPLWKDESRKRELKPQFFPDQLSSMLGMTLATEGHAAGLLFPQITPGAQPALLDDPRTLGEDDYFTASTEDRYPDVFGLLPITGSASPDLANHFADLPRQALTLGHDTAANASALEKAASLLIS
ncbi:hypothetical protein [Streptomyces sp. NBC_01022]|uniref:hypothetical protein n=1 Tax=Streptomyces sp. NBC_01022 TaxID=2903723 RepID=UPI002DD7E5E3|nr:hypothetical protein [Streptomyces sp. NBC_01022]WRZ86146.1 hypothetical protein OG316_40655 [Streptomyces sp. NBC_01022]